MTTSEALQKLQHYCSYQERSPFEVDRKLQQLGLPRDRHEEVIAQLMEDSFWIGVWPGLSENHLIYIFDKVKSFLQNEIN